MTLKKVNDILTVVVSLLGLYIIVMPFLPNLQLAVARYFDDNDGVVYRSELARESGVDESNLAEPPEGKRLVIPSIQLNQEIIIGSNPNLVHKGAWHRPNSANPGQGSNTVIVGHRFTYSSPATFYHLDKIETGDLIDVWWDGTEYIYKVSAIEVVYPSQVSVEAATDSETLTLYTCTPLWTAKQRLVIRAQPIFEGVDGA